MRFLKRRGVVASLFGEDVANRLEPAIKDNARKRLMLWRDKAKQRMLEERMNEKVCVDHRMTTRPVGVMCLGCC